MNLFYPTTTITVGDKTTLGYLEQKERAHNKVLTPNIAFLIIPFIWKLSLKYNTIFQSLNFYYANVNKYLHGRLTVELKKS